MTEPPAAETDVGFGPSPLVRRCDTGVQDADERSDDRSPNGARTRTPTGSRPEVSIEVRDVVVHYGSRVALGGVSTVLRGGELLAVCGPNGCGKSTLLRAVLGLVPLTSGQVVVRLAGIGSNDLADGEAEPARLLAHVPQDTAVDWRFPATVRDVVRLGRLPHRRPVGTDPRLGRGRRRRAADRAAVADAMQRLRITDLADRPIGELSGGQRQRMLVARALAQHARVLLLDEPFTGVDAVTEGLLWQQLHTFAADGGAVAFVHHDIAQLRERATRVLLLDGRVVADGPPHEALAVHHLGAAYGWWATGDPAGRGGSEVAC